MPKKILVVFVTLVLFLVFFSCSANTIAPSNQMSPTEIGSTSPGATSPPGVPPVTASPTIAGSPSWQIQEYVTRLQVPWEMVFAADGRIFVTERPGRIRIIKGGQLQNDPWITLDVAAVSEGGLLGMALDPQFSENHFVYAAYTFRDNSGTLHNRVIRLMDNPANSKGAQDKTLIDNIGGGPIHDGGRLKFGPDQKLYYTIGDSGNSQLAQDVTSLNGKILRINSDGSIPEDNPFPDSPVYCFGNRNPEGIAWQPGTNRLYATEHGSSAQDEVNFIEPGKNYGWPVITGDRTQQGMVAPVIHSGVDTWAPAGAAFVVGGPWDGSFLFTGLRGQSLYRLALDRVDPFKVVALERFLNGQYGRLRNVVQGPDNGIYLLTNNTDGRGSPGPGDDKILRLTFK